MVPRPPPQRQLRRQDLAVPGGRLLEAPQVGFRAERSGGTGEGRVVCVPAYGAFGDEGFRHPKCTRSPPLPIALAMFVHFLPALCRAPG